MLKNKIKLVFHIRVTVACLYCHIYCKYKSIWAFHHSWRDTSTENFSPTRTPTLIHSEKKFLASFFLDRYKTITCSFSLIQYLRHHNKMSRIYVQHAGNFRSVIFTFLFSFLATTISFTLFLSNLKTGMTRKLFNYHLPNHKYVSLFIWAIHSTFFWKTNLPVVSGASALSRGKFFYGDSQK